LDTYWTQVNVREGMLVLVDKVVFHPQVYAGSRFVRDDSTMNFEKAQIIYAFILH
jgi:hypothetical protein